jgi:tetratricopeptide (TPR) repeat protein
MENHAERERLLYRFLEGANWERALALARELLASDPDNTAWHRIAGQCSLHLDNPDEAERYLRKALQGAPDDDLALYFLAHSLRLAKRPNEAEEAVRAAIALEPGDSDYWTELGWLAFEREDYSASQRCAQKARDISPHNARASTLLAAAESQLSDSAGGSRGDPQAQISALKRTLELDPENDAALHNIGVVYFNELRDYHAAERHFRHALSLVPAEKLYQRNLIRSLRRQDPALRVLYAPWHAAAAGLEAISRAWDKRWPFLVGLPLIPFVIVGALLIALFWAIFLWPPAAFYQFLTRSDIACATGRIPVPQQGSSRSKLPPKNPQQWPKTARLALFFATFTAFWLVLIVAFRALAFRDVIVNLLSAMLIGWVAIGIYACGRELFAKRERRRRGRAIDLLEE